MLAANKGTEGAREAPDTIWPEWARSTPSWLRRGHREKSKTQQNVPKKAKRAQRARVPKRLGVWGVLGAAVMSCQPTRATAQIKLMPGRARGKDWTGAGSANTHRASGRAGELQSGGTDLDRLVCGLGRNAMSFGCQGRRATV